MISVKQHDADGNSVSHRGGRRLVLPTLLPFPVLKPPIQTGQPLFGKQGRQDPNHRQRWGHGYPDFVDC
jgi:hypothetical protein